MDTCSAITIDLPPLLDRNSQINGYSKKNDYQPAILAQPDLE
ncbi:hypothetical protein ACOHX9_000435 [Yersinia enterocolitica]|nr:hypothetical protein [Yersinia enterocolitica]UXD28922.1 hypothetical protein FORC066_1709 [Yersinia enterocolitica]